MSGIVAALESRKTFVFGAAALGVAQYVGAPLELKAAAAAIALAPVAIAVLRALGRVLGKIWSWLRPAPAAPASAAPKTSAAETVPAPKPVLPPATPGPAASTDSKPAATVAAVAATALPQPSAPAPVTPAPVPPVVETPAVAVDAPVVAAPLPATPVVVAAPVASAAPAAVSTLAVPVVLKADAATSPTPPAPPEKKKELFSFSNKIVTFSVEESQEAILAGPGEIVICAIGEKFHRRFSFLSPEGESESRTSIQGRAIQDFVPKGTYKRLAKELLLLKSDKFVFVLQSKAWTSLYDTMNLASYIEQAFDPDQNTIIPKTATSKTIRLIFPDAEKARSYLSSREAKQVSRSSGAALAAATAAAPKPKAASKK